MGYKLEKMYGFEQRVDRSSLINSQEKVNSEIINHRKPEVSDSKSNDKKKLRHCGGRNGLNGYISWVFFIQNILMIYATYHTGTDNESKWDPCGRMTPGRTSPHGDIILEYGQPLKIYCILQKSYMGSKFPLQNASDLVFSRDSMLIEPEHITIINETTIMMYDEKPSPSSNMYYCKLKSNQINQSHQSYTTVCLNKVMIGFKPEEPKNFTCVSHNWESLVCSWEPVPSVIETRFSLSFKLPGRAGGRATYLCPKSSRNVHRSSNTCFWNIFTDPMYRQVYEYMTMILNAENALGTSRFTYKFHHYAHVIPSKPVDLSVANKTCSSVLLSWKVPPRMSNFPPGLYHRIYYRSQWDSQESWQTIDITDHRHAEEKQFNITDLQANSLYEVRVISKSTKAIGEDKWSEYSDILVKTAPTVPGKLPKIDIGSFEISGISGNRRDISVYWQSIPQHFKNGDNFTYQAVYVEENGSTLDLQPEEISETFAKFKGISLNNLTFEIVAANCKGTSDDRVTIRVSNQLEIPQKPVVFTKIEFDKGVYELSWNSSRNSDIVDYTIFWCQNDRDRPYQCSGYLDWIHVPEDTRVYNLTVPDPQKIYQFGIAANTAQASSGIAWFSGMTIFSNLVGKMKSVSINRVESDLVEIGWELDYVGRIGTVENFNIRYCPIVSVLNITCDGQMMVTTIEAESYIAHGVIRDLRPHTTYFITVAVMTKDGEGLDSDAIYITTLNTPVDPVLKNPIFTDTPSKPVETIDYMTQVRNLNINIAACEKQIEYFSHENYQLREKVLRCNDVW